AEEEVDEDEARDGQDQRGGHGLLREKTRPHLGGRCFDPPDPRSPGKRWGLGKGARPKPAKEEDDPSQPLRRKRRLWLRQNDRCLPRQARGQGGSSAPP